MTCSPGTFMIDIDYQHSDLKSNIVITKQEKIDDDDSQITSHEIDFAIIKEECSLEDQKVINNVEPFYSSSTSETNELAVHECLDPNDIKIKKELVDSYSDNLDDELDIKYDVPEKVELFELSQQSSQENEIDNECSKQNQKLNDDSPKIYDINVEPTLNNVEVEEQNKEKKSCKTVRSKSNIDISNRKHKCPQCPYSSNKINHLNDHIKRHNKDVRYQCELCNYSGVHKNNLQKHMVMHRSEKPFKCDICPKFFNQHKYLKIHNIKLHPEIEQAKLKTYECQDCSYTSFNSDHYTRHRIIHGDVKDKTKYSCTKCPYWTYRKWSFTKHVCSNRSCKKADQISD